MFNSILIDPFLQRGYYLFIQNSESSLEKLNSFFAFLQKANNLIATKMRVNLINNYTYFCNMFSALHNLMPKLCFAFFKYENKLKIG